MVQWTWAEPTERGTRGWDLQASLDRNKGSALAMFSFRLVSPLHLFLVLRDDVGDS